MFGTPFSLAVRLRLADFVRRLAAATACVVATNPAAASEAPHPASHTAPAARTAAWPLLGGGINSQQFSPLADVNASNVNALGLARYTDLPIKEGLVGNVLIEDGTAYESAPRAAAIAIDLVSGRIVWKFEPTLDYTNNTMWSMWTSHNNRGLAIDAERVYTSNGCSLFGLNRKTGIQVWRTRICDPSRDMGTSAAPRVGAGKVFVGIQIAEQGTSRAYAAAYDANTGKELWRFYTTPGDPSRPFENPQMEVASKSWPADYWSKGKGGGSGVWEGMIYDAQTDLLIFGTGNPAPKGDPGWLAAGEDLYSDSIIAVNASTGKYVWHYQTLPGDAWGMSDATGHIILADLPLAGGTRHVLMSAEKQFFYVLDARTGAFISANAYVPNTNFSAMNPKTGKLTVREDLKVWKHPGTAAFAQPGDAGGHTWTLCAYNPQTGLVYIPAYILAPDRYGTSAHDGEAAPKNEVKARLVAWDPVTRKERWHVDDQPAINGGVLTTAGGLVFQGTAGGKFNAYDASTGKRLWSFETHSIIQAGASTVTLQGQQLIVVPAGDASGNGTVTYFPEAATTPETMMAPSRLLVFGLGGKEILPPSPRKILARPARERPIAALAAAGATVFQRNNCALCHGAELRISGRGRIPDLRTITESELNAMPAILQQGALVPLGMPQFAHLSDDDVKALQGYIEERAWQDYEKQQVPASKR
jgi:PQQ-dependent dehydrogenase (methanol/ethanol family)